MRFTSQARVHPRSLWPNCKDPHVALLRPLALDLRWKQSLPLGWDQIPSEPKVNFQTSTPQLSVSAPFNPFSSVQFRRSVLSDSLRPHEPQHARPVLSIPVHHQHPETTQTQVHPVSEPSNHLNLCHPLLLLPTIFPSIRVFSNESPLLIRWPKYWSFNFNISPFNEHPGLISFRMDWLDLLAVQGTFNSLLQHHSSKASILWCSVFFIVQLSHPYMTTGKTIALTRRTCFWICYLGWS